MHGDSSRSWQLLFSVIQAQICNKIYENKIRDVPKGTQEADKKKEKIDVCPPYTEDESLKVKKLKVKWKGETVFVSTNGTFAAQCCKIWPVHMYVSAEFFTQLSKWKKCVCVQVWLDAVVCDLLGFHLEDFSRMNQHQNLYFQAR